MSFKEKYNQTLGRLKSREDRFKNRHPSAPKPIALIIASLLFCVLAQSAQSQSPTGKWSQEHWKIRTYQYEVGDDQGKKNWGRNLGILFEGIELNAEQLAIVDEEVKKVLLLRNQFLEAREERKQARENDDLERKKELDAQLKEMAIGLRPAACMSRMRKAVPAEQRDLYDLNRARVLSQIGTGP